VSSENNILEGAGENTSLPERDPGTGLPHPYQQKKPAYSKERETW